MVSSRKRARSVVVAERRAKAVQMRIAGISPTIIAENLGYSSGAAVIKDITRSLQKAAQAEQMASEQLLQIEIDRLDRLMASVWGKALSGDVKAVDQAEKLIARRCSLLGLDLLNRNGSENADIASLLGNLFSNLKARHGQDDVTVEVVDAIEAGEDRP
ncbi:hypothetical protein B0I32_106257 [Nonomuraea fuscirosea]|uniref:Uncharacterized protein n=1 Tax=Nonomuraea fuscirosea TaxID=1291556 RepID=A0A2T0N2E5_9ACTN|nr:hypothetical protein [Nonomuraea fuscirosea]PRX66121.1 hypothetical protein B0I32_106257 [Nonomuraea fuscirosea]